nr:DUF3526 domain-containing protein [Pseudenhygromyxa sp. WMMC2535]
MVLWLELVQWRRDPRVFGLLCVTALVLVGATIWSTAGDVRQRDAQQQAALAAREQWEGQGAANPHGMAHFGDYVFRPTGPLAQLDRGVQARLGKVVFVGGHRQGVPMHADVARAGTVARFVRPDPGFFLQMVVPLLLIFLGATGLARDRDSGSLKLSLVQGAAASEILRGHILALWGLGLALLALVLMASLATSWICGGAAVLSALSAARLAAFVAIYALFLAFVAAFVVAATTWMSSARAALLTLLVAWVAGTALLPRATAGAAAAVLPLPSQDAFQQQLREARQAGPDGHNPLDAELAARKQAVLDEHGVDSVEALPFNFDGIAMQLDEEFGNRVWDEHYGELRGRLEQQVAVASVVGAINPFQAIDHLSMSLAGTDLVHDLAFQEQVEAYRRELIAKLNHEHAYGGSRTDDWSWEAPAEFFAGLESFEYHPPSLLDALGRRIPELIGLMLWTALLLGALRRAADRLERGTLPC